MINTIHSTKHLWLNLKHYSPNSTVFRILINLSSLYIVICPTHWVIMYRWWNEMYFNITLFPCFVLFHFKFSLYIFLCYFYPVISFNCTATELHSKIINMLQFFNSSSNIFWTSNSWLDKGIHTRSFQTERRPARKSGDIYRSRLSLSLLLPTSKISSVQESFGP